MVGIPHLVLKVSARISLRIRIHISLYFGGGPFLEGVVGATALCWRCVMPDSKPKPGQVQILKDRISQGWSGSGFIFSWLDCSLQSGDHKAHLFNPGIHSPPFSPTQQELYQSFLDDPSYINDRKKDTKDSLKDPKAILGLMWLFDILSHY